MPEDYFFLVGMFIALAGVLVLGGKAGDKIDRLAKAIAKAEGFYVDGSLPQRTNNPGDLKIASLAADWSDGKAVFPTVDEGWAALRKQLSIILNGTSNYYRPTDTFARFAQVYTGGDDSHSWLETVTSTIGTSPDQTLKGWYEA